jgi:branched-subunit amino acid transport protein
LVAPELTLSQARRNQLIIAGISTILLATLWAISDLPRSMYFALPPVIVALWVPAVLAHKQRDVSRGWNVAFGVLGLAVAAVVVRAVWLIGRG